MFISRSIWISREKELLQEISGMGELGGEWRNKQTDLLEKHLRLLTDYSHAKQILKQYSNKHFRPSPKKSDEGLEFAPLNLHLQRMWAYNNTLKRSGALDVITVGAFARYEGRSKTGGLIRLLHQIKESPNKPEQGTHKVQATNDAVQAIKELRKEIVEIMLQLLQLAKSKNTAGMLPLCNSLIQKTRTLLTIWEPSIVRETFNFIEAHRIVEDPTVEPFKAITEKLGHLDLRSPYLEDFATPMTHTAPNVDVWANTNPNAKLTTNKIEETPNEEAVLRENQLRNYTKRELLSCSMPPSSFHFTSESSAKEKKFSKNDESNNEKAETVPQKFIETHFDGGGEVTEETEPMKQTETAENLKKIRHTKGKLNLFYTLIHFICRGLSRNLAESFSWNPTTWFFQRTLY